MIRPRFCDSARYAVRIVGNDKLNFIVLVDIHV